MSLPFEIPPVPDGSARQSPFTPTFGAIPPLLADRQNLINDFAYALDSGPGARGRATLVTGTRGVGKSVMLRVFRDVVESRQWLTVSARATSGFVDRLTTARLPEALSKLDTANTTRTRLRGGSLSALGFGGSVNTESENTAPVTPDFHHQLIRTLEILDDHGTGLLLTLDEVHRSHLEELQEVADALSTAVADGAPFAFAAAGLPETINGLVNDDVSTFLRRAERVNLGNLSSAGAAVGLRVPIEAADKRIGDEALSAAVESSSNYPYLVQLIGDNAWRAAGSAEEIALDHVQEAAQDAKETMFRQIHEPTLASLPERERQYVAAVSASGGTARTGAVADRMGLSASHAGVFRDRLINRGVITSPRRGEVEFSIPYTADFLRSEQAKAGKTSTRG
ncbi:ATP-binding protein [Brevibacterium oceani]|uniref:ATP-binding protein n=1 Tax=Brevibacterium oceani TaxID=358099 RepID=UPI0015E735ED|nr:ATP-binding protein [Brevibacterium oceani]